MNKLLITLSLAALLAVSLPSVSSNAADSTQFALSAQGVLVHEGTGVAEIASISVEALTESTFRDAPFNGLDGVATILIETETRTIALPMAISADVLAREIAGRSVEAWDISLAGDDATGAMALKGADGFLRGAGELEFFIPSGSNHGRFDLAFAGTAEVLQ